MYSDHRLVDLRILVVNVLNAPKGDACHSARVVVGLTVVLHLLSKVNQRRLILQTLYVLVRVRIQYLQALEQLIVQTFQVCNKVPSNCDGSTILFILPSLLPVLCRLQHLGIGVDDSNDLIHLFTTLPPQLHRHVRTHALVDIKVCGHDVHENIETLAGRDCYGSQVNQLIDLFLPICSLLATLTDDLNELLINHLNSDFLVLELLADALLLGLLPNLFVLFLGLFFHLTVTFCL
mmetsp:Transcript_8699/g.32068  ORF Transcript_8699/g.32068 Transcript_8699/m.32068 type:complete len:235 (-) Transcript_8699:673-1377(-)